MRLIDADVINGTFVKNDNYRGSEVMALLKQQPTVYDIDKVVEQLGKLCDCAESRAAEYDKAGKIDMREDWMKITMEIGLMAVCLECQLFEGNEKYIFYPADINLVEFLFSKILGKNIPIPIMEKYRRMMERQEAMPPLIGKGRYICPKCKSSRNINQKYTYCPDCGQKLDWK